ncbi:MAG: hypothetical protein ACFFBW_15025 [Promethearchaeota archaeon]
MSEIKKKKSIGSPIGKKKVLKRPSKLKTISAISLLALGVVLMPSGFLLSDIIQGEIDKGVADYVKVPHPHSSEYDEWVSNDYDDAPEYYRTYYLWDLTNPDEFLAGNKPIYQEVGPFVFREIITKYDIDWSDDKEEVAYKEYSTYYQVSNPKISEVNITNINPAYLGALTLSGGEDSDFIRLMIPIVLSEIKDIFSEEMDAVMADVLTEEGVTNLMNEALPDVVSKMIDDFIVQLPEVVDDLLDSLLGPLLSDLFGILFGWVIDLFMDFATEMINNLKDDLGPGLAKLLGDLIPPDMTLALMEDVMADISAEDIMYYEWANDYFPEIEVDLTDTMLYLRNNLKTDDLRKLIYDVAEIFAEDYSSIETLLLYAGDMMSLINWLIDPLIPLIFDLLGDLGAQALMETMMTRMIRDISAGLVDSEGSKDGVGVDIDGREPYNYPGKQADLNISMHSKGGSGLNLEQCHALWDKSNPNSLTGMKYVDNKIWYEALDGNQESKNSLMTEFEIEPEQLELILDWIDVSCNDWVINVVEWSLDDWNSGFVVTRTAEEWLFTANDTAVYEYCEYYEEDTDKALIGFFDNCHNEIEAEEAEVPKYTIKTGRDDISEVGQVVEYNGQEEINIWAEPIEVEGTLGTQFAPGVSEEDDLKAFNIDLMRVVELEYDEPAEIYGIELLNYELAEDTFSPDPLYFQDTEGLANLEVIEKYQDVPVRVSKPHLLGTPAYIQEGVIGMLPQGNIHDTHINVEPITGLVMDAAMRAQVNFEVNPTEIYLPNISNTIMPILWMEVSGEITEELAERFKELVYGAMELKETVPLVGLAAGAALCVPGAALTTSQTTKRRKIKKARLAKGDKLAQQKGIITKRKVLGDSKAPNLKNDGISKPASSSAPMLKNGGVPDSKSD